jgi:hypothetical protein
MTATHPRPLALRHGGATLVVYAFHVLDRNVRFFMRHGLVPDKKVDYMVVQNMPEWAAEREADVTSKWLGLSSVTWVKRPNVSQDIGAYSEAMRTAETGGYDYFVFVNSTMRGPFLPMYFTEHWTRAFTAKLTDVVALVGSSINHYNGQPHVQSMAMAMDQRGLGVLRHAGVMLASNVSVRKPVLVKKHEIGGSKEIMARGYNLDCMLTAYRGMDWRKRPIIIHPYEPRQGDLWGHRNYFGRTLNPYETVFMKTNRDYDPSFSDLNLLSGWWEQMEVMDVKRDRRGYVPQMHAADEVLGNDARDDERSFGAVSRSRDLGFVWPLVCAVLSATLITFIALWATGKGGRAKARG